MKMEEVQQQNVQNYDINTGFCTSLISIIRIYSTITIRNAALRVRVS